MRVSVERAKAEFLHLLARVEAGEDVEIVRGGRPVARLVPIEAPGGPGSRFLAARGSLAGRISIGGDVEFTEAELDEFT